MCILIGSFTVTLMMCGLSGGSGVVLSSCKLSTALFRSPGSRATSSATPSSQARDAKDCRVYVVYIHGYVCSLYTCVLPTCCMNVYVIYGKVPRSSKKPWTDPAWVQLPHSPPRALSPSQLSQTGLCANPWSSYLGISTRTLAKRCSKQ